MADNLSQLASLFVFFLKISFIFLKLKTDTLIVLQSCFRCRLQTVKEQMMKAKQIVVFESDKAICELIELLLLEEGYDVISSTHHRPFQDSNELPDLILIDNWLNHRSGANICQELKTNPRTAHIPVVITSTDDKIEDLAASCLADAYISKPFDIQCVLDQVKKFL